MGVDKALLTTGNGTLIEQVASAVKAATGNVVIIGNADRYQHLFSDCRPDLEPGFGPLSGIFTALTTSLVEWNLICACDMPHLDVAFLSTLLAHAVESGSMCTAAADPDGSVHPLCAVYHRKCLPFVRGAIDSGRLSLMHLLEEVGAGRIISPRALANCNTRDEWTAALH